MLPKQPEYTKKNSDKYTSAEQINNHKCCKIKMR